MHAESGAALEAKMKSGHRKGQFYWNYKVHEEVPRRSTKAE